MIEPVAVRYDFDGYGWIYLDSGSGSDWERRHPEAEPLYIAEALEQVRAEERARIVALLRKWSHEIDKATNGSLWTQAEGEALRDAADQIEAEEQK